MASAAFIFICGPLHPEMKDIKITRILMDSFHSRFLLQDMAALPFDLIFNKFYSNRSYGCGKPFVDLWMGSSVELSFIFQKREVAAGISFL